MIKIRSILDEISTLTPPGPQGRYFLPPQQQQHGQQQQQQGQQQQQQQQRRRRASTSVMATKLMIKRINLKEMKKY